MEGGRSDAASACIGIVVAGMCLISCSLPALGAGQSALSFTDHIDGASIWQNATDLEAIGDGFPAYRCAGSAGANASASWIKDRFAELGLVTWLEEFDFWGWDLRDRPEMNVIYSNATGEQSRGLGTFQAEQFSSPSLAADGIKGVVLLPLPATASMNQFASMPFNSAMWSGIGITDKVVLIGREVRWNSAWEEALAHKLAVERPSALVYFYSQSWTSGWSTMFMSSSGGLPLSNKGDYLLSNSVPAGHIDAQDSEWLLARMGEGNVSARLSINSTIGVWAQKNVVAKLPGSNESAPMIMLTAHYDSVMDPGFCDNAASVASLLEIAKELRDLAATGEYPGADMVRFVAFTGEEQSMVGSTYYYASHASEMSRVRAVVNLDCLGGTRFIHSITADGGGLDLDRRVDDIAGQMGMAAMAVDDTSDQATFLDPQYAAQSLEFLWELSPSIASGAQPVASSIGLFSGPLTPQDAATYGQMGWIHTSRDDSGFALSTGWITADGLREQAKVALALLLEIPGQGGPSAGPENALLITLVLIVVAVAVVVVFLLRRGRA